jgi:hypothetical protein
MDFGYVNYATVEGASLQGFTTGFTLAANSRTFNVQWSPTSTFPDGVTYTVVVEAQVTYDGVVSTETIDLTFTVPPNNCPDVSVSGPDVTEDEGYVLELNEDSSSTITITATDDDYDTLSFAFVSNPTFGVATVNDATTEITYTPNSNYNGADSFSFSFTDTFGCVVTTPIDVIVVPQNDPPSSESHTFTGIVPGTVISVPLDSFDPEGTPTTLRFSKAPSLAREPPLLPRTVWTPRLLTLLIAGAAPTTIPLALCSSMRLSNLLSSMENLRVLSTPFSSLLVLTLHLCVLKSLLVTSLPMSIPLSLCPSMISSVMWTAIPSAALRSFPSRLRVPSLAI